jgi:hypothetical protein
MSPETSTFPQTSAIVFSDSGCLLHRLDPQHIEVWGDDISEHYLFCYDEQQSHLVDVIYIPFETDVERHYGMVQQRTSHPI